MSDPLVSVIVPLYNYRNYIRDCIQSIKNQDYLNYELFVIDDCSTDDSYEVVKSFQNEKIKVIKLDVNRGYSTAKNEAIIMSQGDLITCLDADDMMTKDSISVRVRALLENDSLFIHAMALTVSKKSTLKMCYGIVKGKRQNPRIHAQTVMLKREVHQKFGLYDEKLRSRSDKEMWWRLFGKNDGCACKISKYFLKHDVAYYRLHNKSMMAKRRKDSKLQERLTKQLEKAYRMRQKEITVNNTRFLER